MKLNNKVLIGTHHKTGTVWMLRIFRAICQKLELEFFYGKQEELPRNFDIFFQEHSRFDLDKLQMKYKGIHLIRDPRDIIVSGCFYHQKSQEQWLHIKRKEFGGLTYQEKINSYYSLDEQIMFEMENLALLEDIQEMLSIRKMLSWNYNNPAFIEIKYEDLISDENLLLFHKIFTFLGFPNKYIPEILRIAYDNSLFNGNLQKSIHIRSGEARQWEKYFKHSHKLRFLELFDAALIELEYEKNDDWASN
jgi:hypothetical protein